MPRDSSPGKDVEINISIPIYDGSSTALAARRLDPWGAPCPGEDDPGRAASLKKILARLGDLLEVAQAAHRAGHLCQDGAGRLSWLQCWYSELQAELRCLERPTPPTDQK
jgi:hypothetical protein